jgi:hypothetical protein
LISEKQTIEKKESLGHLRLTNPEVMYRKNANQIFFQKQNSFKKAKKEEKREPGAPQALKP